MGLFDGYQFDPATFSGGGGLLGMLNFPQPVPSAGFAPTPVAPPPAPTPPPAAPQTVDMSARGNSNPISSILGSIGGLLAPAQANAQEGPGVGDRLMAGFQGFANSQSPMQALGNLVGGLASGHRMDSQGMSLELMRSQMASLMKVPGMTPDKAMAIAMNPAIAAKFYSPTPVEPGSALIDPMSGKTIGAVPNKPVSVQPGAALMNPDTGKVIGTNEGGTLAPSTMTQLADQYLAGDTSVLQNNGRNGVNSTMLRNRISQRMQERGISPEQVAANIAAFMGQKSTERAIGTRVATVEMPVVEAQNLAPQVLSTSAQVDRTRFPALNTILQAGEKGVGDPNVVRFGIAVNSFINVYSRAISPTGQPTVSDKDHARDLLSTAWSKGQIEAGMDQLLKELSIARKSPGIVRKELQEQFVGQRSGNPVSHESSSAATRYIWDPVKGLSAQ